MILAQDQAGHSPMQIFTISLILIGLLVVGCVAVLAVKRKLRQPDDLGGASGFTLSDLRQMRKTGQISDEEFEKAKGLIVQASRRADERETSRRAEGDLSVARKERMAKQVAVAAEPAPTDAGSDFEEGDTLSYGRFDVRPGTEDIGILAEAQGALVYAIVGLIIPCVIPNVVAIGKANRAKAAMTRTGTFHGHGMATAAQIIAWVGLVVLVPIVGIVVLRMK